MPSELPGSPTDSMKTRVLFVCYGNTGNTCRSVIAEHVARQRFGHALEPGRVPDKLMYEFEKIATRIAFLKKKPA